MSGETANRTLITQNWQKDLLEVMEEVIGWLCDGIIAYFIKSLGSVKKKLLET